MTNAEMIKALRHCGNCKRCNECPMGNPSSECFKMLLDAADAIEAADKRIAELEAVDAVPVVRCKDCLWRIWMPLPDEPEVEE